MPSRHQQYFENSYGAYLSFMTGDARMQSHGACKNKYPMFIILFGICYISCLCFITAFFLDQNMGDT